MHGPHDVGGRDGLGPIATEFLEPGIPDWRYPFEGRMHAVTAMAIAKGAFNLDEQRHGIELMKWSDYTDSTYYAHWLFSVEKLLNDKGYITPRRDRHADGRTRSAEHDAAPREAGDPVPLRREDGRRALEGHPARPARRGPPVYDVGATVRVRNIHDTSTTACPGTSTAPAG